MFRVRSSEDTGDQLWKPYAIAVAGIAGPVLLDKIAEMSCRLSTQHFLGPSDNDAAHDRSLDEAVWAVR